VPTVIRILRKTDKSYKPDGLRDDWFFSEMFVVFYEEPALRGKFGADYETYCRNVDRWWPRVGGWDKPQ
jgi:hypothetical protein